MELKEYQKEVIADLRSYLDHIENGEPLNKAFASYWGEKGIDISNMAADAYLHPYDNTVKGVPNVTVKVPTAGGKTFIACNALKPIFEHYPAGKPRVVAWFVPSDEILRQTLRNLRNPNHPYRQRLNSLFYNRVQVVGKEEALMGQGISPISVINQVTIFVLSVSSFAANNKEGRRSYRENENLAAYAKLYDSLTSKVEGADETSLMQVLSYLNPVVIVDESHNFVANLRVELLNAINPFFILNLTATPKAKSNIISFVDAIKLKRANMVKLPVIVYNHHTVDEVIVNAITLQRSLEQKATVAEDNGGAYIRPIVLFQAQPRTNEDNVTFDRIKKSILELGIPEDQIKIKTADRNELKDIDLLSKDCPVRYIITVDALKEGWDCPFAYILASLANRTSRISVEQILGRILRLPYTSKNANDLLNISYVFTSSRDFSETLNGIIQSLNNAGFSRKDFRKKDVLPVDGYHQQEGDPMSGLLFGGPEAEDATADEVGGDLPQIDTEYIKSKLEATSDATQKVEAIEEFAKAQSDSYEEELEKHEENRDDVPTDLQEVISMNGIKDLYPEAREMVLPRFARKVKTKSIFEEADSFVELDKAMLEEGFDLSTQDKNINFTLTDSEAVSIDLGKVSNDDEYEVKRKELSSRQISIIREQFVGMPDENRRNNIARNIARRMKLDSIPEHTVVDYVKAAIANLDSEKIEDILSRDVLYAECVKKKVEGLLQDYRKKKFKEMLDTREVVCTPMYKFPNSVVVNKESLGMYSGLYMKEGDMNGFEERVIRKVSELDNVLFWHRNPERTGFGINGFINHYPDFIVRLKNGVVVLIETKGDDRDNSDSRNKIELGKAWENKAGDMYHYYMVFDNKKVDDALTMAELIERIKQL